MPHHHRKRRWKKRLESIPEPVGLLRVRTRPDDDRLRETPRLAARRYLPVFFRRKFLRASRLAVPDGRPSTSGRETRRVRPAFRPAPTANPRRRTPWHLALPAAMQIPIFLATRRRAWIQRSSVAAPKKPSGPIRPTGIRRRNAARPDRPG